MVSANCGVPPVTSTSTLRVNATVASTRSASPYVTPFAGRLVSDRPLTPAAVRLPATL